jgi:hypothetical protein
VPLHFVFEFAGICQESVSWEYLIPWVVVILFDSLCARYSVLYVERNTEKLRSSVKLHECLAVVTFPRPYRFNIRPHPNGS